MALLARTLSAEERETLLAFARQVAVDACSTVCVALDGNTSLAGQFFEFSLVDEQGQQHVGALQEGFLELVHSTAL